MKISYSWLQQHIDIQESPERIAELLTQSGLEVEAVYSFEKIKGGLEGLVIAKVLTCEKHPGADKLSKTTVEIGNGIVVPIVCGAPNVAAGQTVVVATVGATMYPAEGESFKISKAKIRGEVSEGMICAEDEIGLGHSHDGIMVLDTDLPTGTPAATFFNLGSEPVLEIGLTPNRGDAASHLGVARDLKALLKRELKKQDFVLEAGSGNEVQVEIENAEGCIRYTGVAITGISVAPSPQWLKDYLLSIGINPINNVVDCTNFILHDLGQPLHAFDLAAVKGNKIVVKTLPEATEFITLDGETRKLCSFDLMVCNEVEPMCIAGVLGGKKSGVTDSTTGIFLESACFSPDFVRKSSTAHGLKTDSSFRFERGTDPDMPLYALKKAVNLIIELAGGKVSSEVVDYYPNVVNPYKVETTFTGINRLIGKVLPQETIVEILTNLDIVITQQDGNNLSLEVATYRTDVRREADIIEEIIRIYGYDNIEIPERISAGYLAAFPAKNPEKINANLAKLLAGSGYNEIITNSLTKPVYATLLGVEQTNVEILNKLSEDLGVMRQSLLFSGLEVAAYNINRRQKDLKFFEFGTTYHKIDGKYKELSKLALFLTGSINSETWLEGSKPNSFFQLKQTVNKILERLNIKGYQSLPAEEASLAYGLTYKLKQKNLVSFGPVKDKLLKATDLKQQVWYAEFDMAALYSCFTANVVFEEISKLPEVRRDLSLVLDKGISFSQIQELAAQKERKLLKSLNVFDVYEGKNIGEDKKSYSISFTLLDEEKMLTDETIDKTMEKFMAAFEKDLGAVIRK